MRPFRLLRVLLTNPRMPRVLLAICRLDRRAGLLGILAFMLAPGLGAQAASRFASSVLSGWSASLGALGGWEEGLQFVNGAPAQATSGGVGGSVAKLWQTRRDRIEASATGAVVKYQGNPLLDRVTYDVNTGITHTFSRAIQAQVGAGIGEQILNQALTPSGTGPLLLTLVRASTKSAGTALRMQFGRKVGAELAANGQDIRTGTVGVFGGQFGNVAASLNAQINRETNVSLVGSSQFSRIDTTSFILPRIAATAIYIHRSGFTAGASAGTVFAPTSVDLPLSSRVALSGSVGFRLGTGQYSAVAQREVQQAFGFGSGLIVFKSVSGVATKRFTRAFSADGSYSVGRQDVVGASTQSARIDAVSLGLTMGIARGAGFSFSAFARRFEDGVQRFVSRGVTTGFTYRWSQQRRSPPRAR